MQNEVIRVDKSELWVRYYFNCERHNREISLEECQRCEFFIGLLNACYENDPMAYPVTVCEEMKGV